MGPSLFSSDLSIFATETPDGLGSHLDMLHSSPFCKGIAHEQANVYWVFNDYDKALDRYDFAHDHGPGHDDHSDGEIYRYAAGEVLGVDATSSHIFYSPKEERLYVADTGHKRLLKLDPTSGVPGASFDGQEPVKVRERMDGATLIELVPRGRSRPRAASRSTRASSTSRITRQAGSTPSTRQGRWSAPWTRACPRARSRGSPSGRTASSTSSTR